MRVETFALIAVLFASCSLHATSHFLSCEGLPETCVLKRSVEIVLAPGVAIRGTEGGEFWAEEAEGPGRKVTLQPNTWYMYDLFHAGVAAAASKSRVAKLDVPPNPIPRDRLPSPKIIAESNSGGPAKDSYELFTGNEEGAGTFISASAPRALGHATDPDEDPATALAFHVQFMASTSSQSNGADKAVITYNIDGSARHQQFLLTPFAAPVKVVRYSPGSLSKYTKVDGDTILILRDFQKLNIGVQARTVYSLIMPNEKLKKEVDEGPLEQGNQAKPVKKKSKPTKDKLIKNTRSDSM